MQNAFTTETNEGNLSVSLGPTNLKQVDAIWLHGSIFKWYVH